MTKRRPGKYVPNAYNFRGFTLIDIATGCVYRGADYDLSAEEVLWLLAP